MNYIDLSILNDNNYELFWKEISKNSNSQSIKKVLLMKNLTDYIHKNIEQLIQPNSLLQDNINNFLNESPNNMDVIYSDCDYIYEFYRLLATFNFPKEKNLSLSDFEENIEKNKFINIKVEALPEIMEEILKTKRTFINIDEYIKIMEKMNEEFQNKLAERAHKKIVFTEDQFVLFFPVVAVVGLSL